MNVLGHKWEPGEGTVVDIRYSGQHGTNNVGAEPHFLMDVRPDSGAAPYRTEVDELPLFLAFKAPAFGQVVKLECDPARGKARFVRSDPAINKKGDEQALKARYDAERDAAVGGGPAAQPAQPDAIAQLERIAKLRDSGALTDEEFELQKRKIL